MRIKAEELMDILYGPVPYEDEMREKSGYLQHYGVGHTQGGHSGRYPWGSGETPYQRSGDFLDRYNELKRSGMNENDIVKELGLNSSTDLRRYVSIASHERRAIKVAKAKELRAQGMSYTEIGREMGISDNSVKSLLNEVSEGRMMKAKATADLIKSEVDKYGMVEVGKGTEYTLDISATKLDVAVQMLKNEGYEVYAVRVPQQTNPGKYTTSLVMCPPGTPYSKVYENDFGDIHFIEDQKRTVDNDGNDTFKKNVLEYPASMDSSRLDICYPADGGDKRDGLIELRRGCEDLTMGDSNYAQVRILVDGDKYLKGMAVYSDDLPDGIDVRFNTSKPDGTPMEKVLKEVHKEDPDNPFGALIKDNGQDHYIGEDGQEHLGLVNRCREEGDWSEWSHELPSQFLGKQSYDLIEKQLGLSVQFKEADFEEIKSITNPVLKQHYLSEFADSCDAASVDLKAVALPGQRYHVIMPFEMPDNQVYAPNYEDGTKLALVRFPHAGQFEIPIVTVNNKLEEPSKTLGKNSPDAVGISSNTAKILSGADFDGDTVMTIPCNTSKDRVHIENEDPLKGLKDFDPHLEYGGKEPGTFRVMTKDETQKQMGIVSNLITDMTLKGANSDEMARAVRHSMVVIDACKHKLDYKQSEVDNGIDELKRLYQSQVDPETGAVHYGASTLLSKAKSPVQIDKRVGQPHIDSEGNLVYKQVHETYTDKNGKTKVRQIEVPAMSLETDARSLSSGTPKEEIYANYANRMKELAREARLEYKNVELPKQDKNAKTAYAAEVSSLNHKLQTSLKNGSREKQAQMMANASVKAKQRAAKDDGITIEKKQLKKMRDQALKQARQKVGASRTEIKVTHREWEAIMANALTATTLRGILRFANKDSLREMALPKNGSKLSPAQEAKIRTMKQLKYTNKQIADAVGCSVSTVNNF